mmetsp:Transcript_39310/g.91761  ORF Transcript_39310/g.91761 Transcript_39310/m.91761 type:complete len:256 (-) Transcript_39310:514-1281(-)
MLPYVTKDRGEDPFDAVVPAGVGGGGQGGHHLGVLEGAHEVREGEHEERGRVGCRGVGGFGEELVAHYGVVRPSYLHRRIGEIHHYFAAGGIDGVKLSQLSYGLFPVLGPGRQQRHPYHPRVIGRSRRRPALPDLQRGGGLGKDGPLGSLLLHHRKLRPPVGLVVASDTVLCGDGAVVASGGHVRQTSQSEKGAVGSEQGDGVAVEDRDVGSPGDHGHREPGGVGVGSRGVGIEAEGHAEGVVALDAAVEGGGDE